MESQIVTNSHSQIAEFRMGINGLTPKMKMDILLNSNTPIETAGTHLKRAGNMLYWGTIATAVGQIFTILGEPMAGTILSLGGTIVMYSGYKQITQAGVQLQQSANN